MVNPSPPPIYNFAIIPVVDQLDPFWAIKQGLAPIQEKKYEDIHLPKNTPMGFYIGMFSLVFGFAMVWHMWWLAIGGLIGIMIGLIIRLSGKDEHEIITAKQVQEIEHAYVKEI